MHILSTLLSTLAGLSLLACFGRTSAPSAEHGRTGGTESSRNTAPALQLVESWPVETTLDHPDIPDAHEVWVAMIDAAERSIDIEHFYASNASPSRLDAIIAALQRAAERGVAIRLVFGKRFYQGDYPDVPDQLAALPGATLRVLDMNALTGGVQHAKFFVVDGRDAYVGSQNFDWRSLTHIQELGVRIRQLDLVAAIASVFERDWSLAAAPDAAGPTGTNDASSAMGEQARASNELAGRFPVRVEYRGQPVEVRPGMSPKRLLTDESLWDLPPLLAMIDSARTRVRVQVLSYSLKNHDGTSYRGLDDALRRAAARGVEVELLLADWNKDEKSIGSLQALQRLANTTVKLVEIPAHSSGFIAFARVIHAKLMTVDSDRSWLSTSNFSGEYFHNSRNISLFFTGASITGDLDRFFTTAWSSEYAQIVDPDADYQPARIAE